MKKNLQSCLKLFVYTICLYSGFCRMARADVCGENQIDVVGDGSNCVDTKFTITTIEMGANTVFKFYMSPSGTFYVDWGDGVVDTIIRNDTTKTLYNHTFVSAGVKTIRFAGRATEYSVYSVIDFHVSNNNVCNILAVDGSLGAIFPTLGQDLSSQQPRFIDTFYTCKQLTSIPETLFDGVFGGFDKMFWATFMGSGITSIPENLFSGITDADDKMFYQTFQECQSLTGYIPPSTFAGLIANGSPTATDMWRNTFYGTKLVKSCPAGTVQYTTGYEGTDTTNATKWNGYVSCVDENLVCGAGEYLPAHWYQCETCPENNYCVGGTYPYSETITSGITQCASGLYSPSGMWESAQCGRILHIGDQIVYLRSVKKTTPSVNVDIDNDGVADFFGNMTTADVVMTRGTTRKLKLQYGGQTYSVYDDSVVLPVE